MTLSDRSPGGVIPTFINNGTTALNGEMVAADDGQLLYQPLTAGAGMYILGHNNVRLIDVLGALIFIGTVLGVFIHGGMRFIAARRNPPQEPELQ